MVSREQQSGTAELNSRDAIENLASQKIRGFRRTIEKGEYLNKVFQSNASMAETVARDYRDRFLIELIQNAYDAHSIASRDGKIEVCLDPRRGAHGALLVANTGRPFVFSNVEDLCDIGLSRKALEESIGNKGLGFRSVVQITDEPKVYSQKENLPSKEYFSGFCFRFANDDDYAEMIDDARHLELARNDLPIYHIPVWLEAQDETVRGYASRGFSSLIELPFRDENALKAASGEISELRSQKAPLLLFLDRVEQLEFRILSEKGDLEHQFSFGRSERKVKADGLDLSRVDLADAGSYMLTRCAVPEAKMKKAIGHAIKSKAISERWSGWKGAGEVALAVRLDAPLSTPRLYTYLPMGEQAIAPLHGYLHASFFPSPNRKHLDASNHLNAILLEEAATLAAETIKQVVFDSLGSISSLLSLEERAIAVADLISWKEVSSLETDNDLEAAVAQCVALNFDCDALGEVPFVPCVSSRDQGDSLVWKSPQEARVWKDFEGPFSAAKAARFADELGVWPIWNGLGAQLDRLDEYLCSHAEGYIGGPSGEERAQLVELVAAEIWTRSKKNKKAWRDFYSHIPDFMGNDAEYLGNRSFLLGDDGELHNAMSPINDTHAGSSKSRRRRRSETAIFSPPDPRRSDVDDDLEVNPPKKLSQRFGFLDVGLPWHADLSPTRNYFEENRLVGEFDREAVLAHLSRTLRDEKNREILRGGLRWAFQLWRQPRAGNRPYKLQPQHRFRVPTIGGDYIDADETYFSSSWPEQTLGSLLQKFIDVAPSGLPEIVGLTEHRLAPTNHPAFREKDIGQWVEFLSELGVKSGLQPISKDSKEKLFSATAILNFSFLESYGIPADFGVLWREDIEETDPNLLNLQHTTEYEVGGDIYWLPGQADIHAYSEECREYYACLILEWLAKDPEIPNDIEINHNVYWRADTRHWPSPVKAFLRTQRWLPLNVSEQIGAKPSELWLNNSDGERFLPFLPRPPRSVRALFDQRGDELIQVMREFADLSVIDDPATLANQLAFLAHRFSEGDFDDFYKPRLLNMYTRSWRKFLPIVEGSGRNPAEVEVPIVILAQRQHVIEPIDMFSDESSSDKIVYVCDSARESDTELLSASGRAFFQIRDHDPDQLGDLFEKFYQDRVRRVSKADVSLLADGEDIEALEKSPILEICPHLRPMVAVSAEALVGTEAQRLPPDRSEILAKLEKVLIARAVTIKFSIDGQNIPQEQIDTAAFHVSLEEGQSAVLVASPDDWHWDLIDRCVPAICEALEQRALIPHLRLLIANLRIDTTADGHALDAAAELQKMAEILRLSPRSMDAARTTLNAGAERNADLIRAVIHYASGMDAVQTFENSFQNPFEDPELLKATLEKLLQHTDVSTAEVLSVATSALGPEDFREQLLLDFAKFNESLVAIGREPETYPDKHSWQLENFLREREVAMVDCLRMAVADKLEKMKPADGYAETRNRLRSLTPDEAWLTQFLVLPENLIEAHVNRSLEDQGVPALGTDSSNLEPLALVREHNRRFLPDFVSRAAPLIRAWRSVNGGSQNQNSLHLNVQIDRLRIGLDDIGVMDFKALDENSAAEWLKILKVWPGEMPTSLDPKVLGLKDEDLEDERIKAKEAADLRRQEARLVAFNGRKLDPHEVDISTLSDEILELLDPSVLNQSLGSSASLIESQKLARSSSASSQKKDKKPARRPRIPEEKTQLIGQLGELVVYHWLCKVLPSQDIDAAWVSENGSLVTGRTGNDGLGYDFEVTYRQQLWQIEVKASTEDPRAFEFGESEVKAARRAARPRSGTQYKIAYVSFVTDASKTQIEILPNPMSEEGARVLDMLGEGIRYGFTRDS